MRTEPIPAARGLILDRDGEVIAGNQPAYQLELVPEEVPDVDEHAGEPGAARADPRRGRRRARAHHRLAAAASTACRSACACPMRTSARFAVRRFEFPGLDIRTRQTRCYPNGGLAVHALGYVGAISEQDLKHIDRATYAGTSLIGKLGVESAYESRAARQQRLPRSAGERAGSLGGAPGRLRAEPAHQAADARRRPGAVDRPEGAARGRGGARRASRRGGGTRSEERRRARAGQPAGLRPDAVRARHHRARSTARCSDDIDRPLFNRALRGTYPPGSTIKPVHRARRPHLPRGGSAGAQVLRRRPSTCRAARACSASTTTRSTATWTCDDAIARSCDVYFYGLARRARRRPHRHLPRALRLRQDSPASTSAGRSPASCPRAEWKAKAFAKPADQVWFPGETVNFGIGQGYLTVTPLQLAHYASIIATRGKIWKPRLVAGLPRSAHRADAARAGAVGGRGQRGLGRGLGPRRARHDRRHAARHGGRHRRARPLHLRRQDRHRAGVHRGAERALQRQRHQRAPARSLLVHRLRAGGRAAHRGRGAGGERRRRRQRRGAHRAQGPGRLPAATDRTRARSKPPRHDLRGGHFRLPHPPHPDRRGARAVRAEDRRSAGGRPGADRRLRSGRALQRLRPEPAAP